MSTKYSAFRRSIVAVCALLAPLMLDSYASAQDCIMGLAGDFGIFGTPTRDGLPADQRIEVDSLQEFSIFLVLFAEAAVEGAAFNLSITENVGHLVYGPQLVGVGPSGAGLNLMSPGGFNMGFQECAYGYGERVIQVAEFRARAIYFATPSNYPKIPDPSYVLAATIEVTQNPDENEDFPVFASCNGHIHTCEVGGPLLIYVQIPVPIQSRSWGTIKSLY